ncbi:HIT family protein [Shouchella shacheensis]|uniref:HIT family protein n=1 Tax=Shouchella shacheensis TaxID=1649580 RepID=UPI0009E7D7CD|nr:HIT family protein [Shouchella shacheensis]
MAEDCIFCKIVSGDIPSTKMFENDHVLAFFDISQVTKGHTLVIPKEHHRDLYALPKDTASQLFEVVPEIASALKDAFEPEGMNILNNNGEIAGQSVFHYHLHLLPRYGEGDGYGGVWKEHGSEYSQQDFDGMASLVKSKL